MNPGLNAISTESAVDIGQYGYQVLRAEAVPEVHSVFFELVHPRTGARHIHIARPDRENAFGVIFKTVPRDSTGVAHILEHVVLCGSERFAVRDPFFSMLKRSLSTFMNAFTASDWTMYPFATQNRKDFYNLMDVYLDAAFFPKLDELSFKQEGHRLEIGEDDSAGERLGYQGVVYNEMKGAMSSPDQVMARSILKALYPDTTYAHNSGGDPPEIPSLTHAQLQAFHRRHYHPSNAFFFTYGDLPLAEHLAFIEKTVLQRFAAIEADTDVMPQPRWDAPRTARYFYPFGRGEDPQKKHQVGVAWLTSDIRDTGQVLCLSLLEQILIGNAGSPLRRALIESGLGSALCDGSGYDAENRDTHFTVGLKDVELSAGDAVEHIIFEVLGGLADQGIDPELIEAAIHQLEFHRREITNTPYPYGIRLLLAISGTWIHGGDPLRVLKFDADLAEIRREMEQGPFFERQLTRYFLENPHRVRLTLSPDLEMAEREAERVRKALEEIRRQLGGEEVEQLRRDAEALRRRQEAPEPLDCLPTLERADIPPEVEKIAENRADPRRAVSYFEQATSGIVYVAAAAGCRRLPASLNALVPFFCHAFARVGTARRDYSAMARRIDAFTGGVGLAPNPRTGFNGSGRCVPFVGLASKSLTRNLAAMFDILAELVGESDFSDVPRLKNLLLEYRAGLEAMIVHNGHRLAMSLASRRFSKARALSEDWSGIHQLKEVQRLMDGLCDERLAGVAADLARVGAVVLDRSRFRLAVIGERDAMVRADDHVANVMGAMRSEWDAAGDDEQEGFPGPRLREGWSTETAVNFVAAAFPTVRLGHADSAALAVMAKLLRSLYLHREIREKGGAYGGFALYNSEDGVFSLASYRDPHIVATLNVFAGAADFLCAGGFDETDIKEAILQVCSEIDKPDPPGPAARKAFFRRIVGLSDEMREGFKQRLIDLSRRQVIDAAEAYFGGGLSHCSVAVIGSEEQLNAANIKLQEPLELHKI
jgi:Zn-dependent M16 (insulinase) family peptidase